MGNIYGNSGPLQFYENWIKNINVNADDAGYKITAEIT